MCRRAYTATRSSRCRAAWSGPESNPSEPVVLAALPSPSATARADVEALDAPAWTLDAGDDGILGPGDTLTLVGGEPTAFAAGWDGAAVRPVTVVATAATPDTVAVFDGPGAHLTAPGSGRCRWARAT